MNDACIYTLEKLKANFNKALKKIAIDLIKDLPSSHDEDIENNFKEI